MSILKTLLATEKAKQRVMWVALLMILFVGVFVFQKSKSASIQSNYSSEKKSEWASLLSDEGTVYLHWLRTLNPIVSKTDGDLIWNTHLQKGLMRFVNLPELKNGQYYRLWVYDLQLSTEKPVSAAAFMGSKDKQEFYTDILPEKPLSQPFKFLLTVGAKGDESFSHSKSLLLAQP